MNSDWLQDKWIVTRGSWRNDGVVLVCLRYYLKSYSGWTRLVHAKGSANRSLSLFFYSGDGSEPAHIHIERDAQVAKFWLTPIRASRDGGFSNRELGEIERIVRENEAALLEAWNDYFGV